MYVWLKLSAAIYYHCDFLLCLFAAAPFYAPNTIHNLEQFQSLCNQPLCICIVFITSYFFLSLVWEMLAIHLHRSVHLTLLMDLSDNCPK
jgi:hypothetical protein